MKANHAFLQWVAVPSLNFHSAQNVKLFVCSRALKSSVNTLPALLERAGRRNTIAANHSYYAIGFCMRVGRNCKPYLVLPLYPSLSPSFWCVCAWVLCHWFCVCSACVGSIAFTKSRTEKIDRGYRFKTCNSSALDKSISDTNTITSRNTFLGFLYFTLDEIYDVICVCMYVCSHVWSREGEVLGSTFERRGELTVQDWTIFIYNSWKIGLSLMTFLSIETCRLLPPFPLKVTNLRTEAAVLFFGGQSAMSTHMLYSRWILSFIPTWIFQSCPKINWK